MAIFLGIDGGGSQTSCLIGNESSILGSGTSAGSNVIRVGEKQAREALAAAIRQACAAGNVTPRQIDRACLGVAGAGRPQIVKVMRRALAELVPGEIELVGDMVIALQSAFGDGPGVIVIAGTGSIAYGRGTKGQTARAGGWGFAVSDEGSGHWIGRTAFAAALRAYDEARPIPLLDVLAKAWGAGTSEKLILMANSSPPPDFAALFPVISSAGEAGDPTAKAVLTKAGSELATLAGVVIGRLFSMAPTVPVAMAGGVFRNSQLVRQAFYNSVQFQCPHALISATVVDPVIGALELARKGMRTKPPAC